MERKDLVKFKGDPMTLVGPELKVGEQAPSFSAVDQNLSPVHLSDFKGKTLIISAVPSLDTGICAEQTRRFNQEAAARKVSVLTISMDLPFAQKRFCQDNSIESLKTVSDYKDREFATNYGLYIKELGLLARAVIVVDPDGKIAYQEIVPEIASHPDYDAALDAASKVTAA